MKAYSSREIIKLLEADGWTVIITSNIRANPAR
jgi:predicted RNA binding protein YcfA (HicA-like mRNA interferase family)